MSKEESGDEYDIDHELDALRLGGSAHLKWIDLDSVGDPCALLDEVLGESPSEILFGGCSGKEEWELLAHHLAEQYLIELHHRGFDPPSAYDEPGEETDDVALFQEDFVAFLTHWRKRAQKIWDAHILK